jgi:hypothetical protein
MQPEWFMIHLHDDWFRSETYFSAAQQKLICEAPFNPMYDLRTWGLPYGKHAEMLQWLCDQMIEHYWHVEEFEYLKKYLRYSRVSVVVCGEANLTMLKMLFPDLRLAEPLENIIEHLRKTGSTWL